jgi:alkanesulfonate monooxygenase SsuD/methylene tetrahydromethanopterin reductase-like flavin-dependent oxidoreductase (luciferase family)
MKEYDPALYRRMSEPFATTGDASEALSAFFEDVHAARAKHRIADVNIAASVNVVAEESDAPIIQRFHIGDQLKGAQMLAYAFGASQEAHHAVLATMISRGRKSESGR